MPKDSPARALLLELYNSVRAVYRPCAWLKKNGVVVPVLFDLPQPELPETGAPAEIVHGCDYDFHGRRLDYYYNFIGYRWKLSGWDFYAKTYLDQPRYLSITIPLARISGDPAFQPVLRWLERRFPYIYTLESNGYVLQYKARYAPEPKDF